MVAELNYDQLENIPAQLDGSLAWLRPIAQAILRENFFGYQLIRENHKTFPPRTICNI